MKRLFAALLVLATLASGAWFGWAALTERAVTGWLDAREAEGWVVTRADVGVTGFPAQFVTAFTDLTLADPATGLVWSAPSFTLRQATLDPGRIEAIWPPSHSLASPHERLTISAADLASVLDLRPAANLALDASQTRMRDLAIESTAGWRSHLAEGQLSMIRQTDTDATYTISFRASDLTPPEDVARLLDPAGVMPAAIPVALSEAVVTFDRPWDLSALEVRRPQPTRIDLSEARAEWGDLMLRLSGAVDVDAEGRATGEVAIRAQNWPAMLDMAERSGALGASMRRSVETALGFLAGLSGRREDLDVTLRLDAGFMYFGPLPVGDAPRLRLR
ncbi:DUF2125 domain-containing protein [Roseicyclus mahoneyensis]|jgi:hypothetical protein|uniref:DUF2125 domain-containing protein n=1 Tax=Roseicyclus mahoneyensis TaxID=164332 RepID=A0A316GJ92_9RHOB|nr:DUF2125 domain-containing protein [Roseicyclus mahoneyensis]PWK59482.1 hypothetical protein C7455_10727 [Roseicyclus mahoneyensis]